MHEAEETSSLRVGYVLKKYPRLSETFILNEILGLEELGVEVSIHSITAPDEGRFHADLSRVRAGAEYLPQLRSAEIQSAFEQAASLADLGRLRRATDFVRRVGHEKGALLLVQALHLAREVQRRRVDHLHAHFMTVAARLAYLTHLLTDVPFSVTAHAKDIFRERIDGEVFAEIARAASRLVTVTEFNAEYIARTYLDGERSGIAVIHNGLPLADESFRRGSAPRDRRLVLGVGRLVEKKGFDSFFRVLRALADSGHETRAVLAGDGEERESLLALRDELGLGDLVSMPGALPREEIVGLMRRAGVMLAPCREARDGNRDALPTVLIEAIALGLPVVATRLNGIPEIVEEGEQGLLVDPDDEEGMADAVRRLVSDEALWSRCSDSGPRRARERFDRDVTLPRLVEVFRGSRRARSRGGAA